MEFSIFKTFPDHRVTGRCTYKISDLLTIALLTYCCGGTEYTDMSEFAGSRARSLGLLADCDEHRYPSPDTFERLMKSVSPDELQRCLLESGRKFCETLQDKQIAIDGKKLRGTSPTSGKTDGDYLMNAFVCDNGIFIGQHPLKNKDNEIRAIPDLLDKIDISEATVSIDAIGTQVPIAEKILSKNGHYFLAVKDNQKGLHDEVRLAFANFPHKSEHTEIDAGHGRVEKRVCRIMDAVNITDPDVLSRWPGIRTIVEVASEVSSGNGQTECVRHFISDEDFPDAKYYAGLARGHWCVENQLHWHLDVTFHEDACRARNGFSAQNLSILRKLALQVAKAFDDKKSIRKRLFRSAIDPDYLLKLVLNYKF